MKKEKHSSAFLIIKSARGRRTSAHKTISKELYEKQREHLAKHGIPRIKSSWETKNNLLGTLKDLLEENILRRVIKSKRKA